MDDLIEKYNEISQKIKEQRMNMYNYYSSLSEKKDDFLNHVEFENGAQPPKEMHIYEPKDGYVRFIQNRDYDSNNYLTYIPISKKNHLCKENDIMMDKYGDAGAVRYGIAGAYNVALLKIIPTKNNEVEYIRDFLSQDTVKNVLYQSSQASTRPSLNESTFKGISMPTLSDSLLNQYQNKLSQLLTYELIIKEKINLLCSNKEQLLEKYF